MERLTENYRNHDGSGISKKSLIDRNGKGYPSAAASQIVTKLADYEDADEKGLMLRLPCKKEDIVYDVVLCDDGKYHMFEMMVCAINPFGDVRKGKVWNVYLECVDDCSKAYRSFYDFGKTVFTVKEEAEQVLKKMKSEER